MGIILSASILQSCNPATLLPDLPMPTPSAAMHSLDQLPSGEHATILALHAEAEAEIRARFGDEATPQRLKMGEFPIGSHIIPNPYNRIPGFSVGDHHFVPGFPVMSWPMVEWVLDQQYSALFPAVPEADASGLVHGLKGSPGFK